MGEVVYKRGVLVCFYKGGGWGGGGRGRIVRDLLVRKVPMPKVGLKPASSAARMYSKHSSRLRESEKTMVFLSVMPSLS